MKSEFSPTAEQNRSSALETTSGVHVKHSVVGKGGSTGTCSFTGVKSLPSQPAQQFQHCCCCTFCTYTHGWCAACLPRACWVDVVMLEDCDNGFQALQAHSCTHKADVRLLTGVQVSTQQLALVQAGRKVHKSTHPCVQAHEQQHLSKSIRRSLHVCWVGDFS